MKIYQFLSMCPNKDSNPIGFNSFADFVHFTLRPNQCQKSKYLELHLVNEDMIKNWKIQLYSANSQEIFFSVLADKIEYAVVATPCLSRGVTVDIPCTTKRCKKDRLLDMTRMFYDYLNCNVEDTDFGRRRYFHFILNKWIKSPLIVDDEEENSIDIEDFGNRPEDIKYKEDKRIRELKIDFYICGVCGDKIDKSHIKSKNMYMCRDDELFFYYTNKEDSSFKNFSSCKHCFMPMYSFPAIDRDISGFEGEPEITFCSNPYCPSYKIRRKNGEYSINYDGKDKFNFDPIYNEIDFDSFEFDVPISPKIQYFLETLIYINNKITSF